MSKALTHRPIARADQELLDDIEGIVLEGSLGDAELTEQDERILDKVWREHAEAFDRSEAERNEKVPKTSAG